MDQPSRIDSIGLSPRFTKALAYITLVTLVTVPVLLSLATTLAIILVLFNVMPLPETIPT